MTEAYVAHRIIRRFAHWGVWAFFTRFHVINGENMPDSGPVIITATHHNMMLDPAVLSASVPNQRILHYWSKASLFAHPVANYVLTSSGCIPVDRKNKDRMVLFKGTFGTLRDDKVVALFPEGTSYTEPKIMQIKDGAAWAALEYAKLQREQPTGNGSKGIVIVPVAIVYTNKSKYRSDVLVDYGKPIVVDDYLEEFLSESEGAARSAAKRLAHDIENWLIKSTVNAPDWDTLYSARMARDLLWPDEKSINLTDFVDISQTLVDLLANPDLTPNAHNVKRRLLEYYSLLESARLTHSVLSSLPLPRTLDPNQPVALPSRLYTFMILLRDTLALAIRLPFFLFPVVVHLPVYILSRLGAQLAVDEVESQAQNKVVIGLILLVLFIYPTAFFLLWAFMMYTPLGALISAGIVWLLAVYHNRLVLDHYERAKRLFAAWRVLVGVWIPKRWDLAVSALGQYTTPFIPPENPWVQPRANGDEPAPSVALSPPHRGKHRRKAPSRRLIRHVLRARVEAVKALVAFIAHIDKGAPEERRVKSSKHLAELYGNDEEGWRNGREIVSFLRKRGATIAGLEDSIRFEGEWVGEAVSSDWEGETSDVKEDDLVWVPSSSSVSNST
ncbi:acyltransferase [Thelephora ganbajun]|uniref:Acyltransferase n=1 Tax=Thelephora ganbajun TaxID=370292 RepID=A0ACB6ZMH3_THEGA|nr:acyltransferase [Thelephora ganbajun]